MGESPPKKQVSEDVFDTKVKSEPLNDSDDRRNDSNVKIKEEYSSQDEESMNSDFITDSRMSADSALNEDSEEDIPLVNLTYL